MATKVREDHLELIKYLARLRFEQPILHRELLACLDNDPSPTARALHQTIIDADLLPFKAGPHLH